VDGSYGAKILCRTNKAFEKPRVIGCSNNHDINALIMDGITEGQRQKILDIARGGGQL
jgi:hypothetical protein